jgi:two-component system phosphate regulon response regulator OmpR
MAKRILVVDDDEGMREIVVFVLGRYGFIVETIADGKQLDHRLALQRPDLIILDIMMPGKDGYQICRNLRKNPETRHIPVMILTALAEDIYKRISDDLGVAQHLIKPFHPLVLVESVQKILSEVGENS